MNSENSPSAKSPGTGAFFDMSPVFLIMYRDYYTQKSITRR